MRSSVIWLLMFFLPVACSSASAEPIEKSPKAEPVRKAPEAIEEASPAPGEKAAETETETDAVSRIDGVEVRGTALAVRESYLSASVPGIIDHIRVKRGQRVKKGQVLVELDQRGFILGVKQAQAALDAARAQEAQVETEIKRVEELLASGAAPTATLDQLTAQGKGARANVRMAQAALGQARKAKSDAIVRAPYDGVISDILKQQGENAPAMPPTMLAKLVDTSSLEVQAFFPESSSQSVSVGDTARVVVDSADMELTGEVIFVSDSIAPGTRTFEVRVKVDNPGEKIKAGSFARVRLVSSSATTPE